MTSTNTRICPPWCERTHANVEGSVHRAEVGHLDVQGKRLFVIVFQGFGGWPTVMISGAECLIIEEDQLDDARALFTLLGFPFFAQLIERGQFVVERFNAAARRAATAAENSRW